MNKNPMEKTEMSSRYALLLTPSDTGLRMKAIQIRKAEKRDIYAIPRLLTYGEKRHPESIPRNSEIIDVTSIITKTEKKDIRIYSLRRNYLPTPMNLAQDRLIILRRGGKWFKKVQVSIFINYIKESLHTIKKL